MAFKLVPHLLGDPGGSGEIEFPYVDPQSGKAVLKRGKIIGGIFMAVEDDQGVVIGGKLSEVIEASDGESYGITEGVVVRSIKPEAPPA